MACISLTSFIADCGSYAQNGLENKTYMIAYKDLATVSGSTEVYGTSVGGVVNVISPSGSTKFVKVDGSVNSSSFTDEMTRNDNGSYNFTQGFSIALDSFSAANSNFTKGLIGQPVVVLTKLKSKKWAALGLDGSLYLATASLTVDASTNQRALTFAGDASGFAHEVDPTVVPSIIS